MALMILDHARLVGNLTTPSHPLQPQTQDDVEPLAYLLRRYLWIFFPATEPLAQPRIPSSPGTASGASSVPCNPDLRSASDQSPACPAGSRVPPSSGGSPPESATPRRCPPTRCSRNISLPRFVRSPGGSANTLPDGACSHKTPTPGPL